MKKQKIGAVLFFIGLILFAGTYTGITGFVISENINNTLGFLRIIGLILVFTGIIFMISEDLEKKVQIPKNLEEALAFSEMDDQEKRSYSIRKLSKNPDFKNLNLEKREKIINLYRKRLEKQAKNARYLTKVKKVQIQDYIQNMADELNVRLDEGDQIKIKDQIRKIKTLKKTNSINALSRTYHNHQVRINGEEYDAMDAGVINRANHQGGRGSWRYLFKRRKLVAVAEEQGNGNYHIKWTR